MPTPLQINHLLWDSEGTANASGAVALSATAKGATGNSGAIGVGAGSFRTGLDLTQFDALLLVVSLVSFTAGTSPSFQPELDILDDEGTPTPFALWKPSAATSATKWSTLLSRNAFGGSAPTPSGNTLTMLTGLPIPELIRFAWTVAGSPTAVSWVAYLYGY